jgi:hypothetical protein
MSAPQDARARDAGRATACGKDFSSPPALPILASAALAGYVRAMPFPRTSSRVFAALVCAAMLAACGSLSIRRDTQTSGTFQSTGWAMTILSWDIPKSSSDIARENASDSRLTNLRIENNRTLPYLGWFDWLLDILSIRYTKITGTWGFPPDQK